MNIDWTAGVSIAGADWILFAIVATWLLIAEPVLGRRSFRQFLRKLATGDDCPRTSFYRSWIVQSWLYMALILAVAFLAFDWNCSQLGLRMVHLSASISPSFVAGFGSAALVGAILGSLLAYRGKSRNPGTSTKPRATLEPEAMKMLPHTPCEKRWFAVLALTAGITEEVIWRGVLLAMLVAVFPAMPVPAIVLVMAIMFGWAHLYQGLRGIVATAVLGAVLTALYVATASLILPMVVHVLIDLLAILRSKTHAVRASV